MTCSHCVEVVGRALGECRGVQAAAVDLRSGRAVVTGGDMRADELIAAVMRLGYQARVEREMAGPDPGKAANVFPQPGP